MSQNTRIQPYRPQTGAPHPPADADTQVPLLQVANGTLSVACSPAGLLALHIAAGATAQLFGEAEPAVQVSPMLTPWQQTGLPPHTPSVHLPQVRVPCAHRHCRACSPSVGPGVMSEHDGAVPVVPS